MNTNIVSHYITRTTYRHTHKSAQRCTCRWRLIKWVVFSSKSTYSRGVGTCFQYEGLRFRVDDGPAWFGWNKELIRLHKYTQNIYLRNHIYRVSHRVRPNYSFLANRFEISETESLQGSRYFFLIYNFF